MRTERQKIIKRLDDSFSEYIRQRAILRVHGCERCYRGKVSYKQLHCAHNQSRVHFGTRWDEDNAAGLCPGCHRYIDREHDEKARFFTELVGEVKYDELMLRANKVHKVDYAAVEIYLKQKLTELDV